MEVEVAASAEAAVAGAVAVAESAAAEPVAAVAAEQPAAAASQTPVEAARALKEAGNRQLAHGQPEWMVKAVASYEAGLSVLGETVVGGGAKALQWELRLNIALVRRHQSTAVGHCARSLPVISDLHPSSQAAVQLEDWSRAVSETSQLLLRVNQRHPFLRLICRSLTLSPCHDCSRRPATS